MKNKKPIKKIYAFSLTPEIKEKIDEMAKEDMRSISGFLEWIIVKEYKNRENK